MHTGLEKMIEVMRKSTFWVGLERQGRGKENVVHENVEVEREEIEREGFFLFEYEVSNSNFLSLPGFWDRS